MSRTQSRPSRLHPGVILDTTDALASQMPGSHQMKLQLQCGRGGIRSNAAFHDNNAQVVRANPRSFVVRIACICHLHLLAITSRSDGLHAPHLILPESCAVARRGKDKMGASGGSSRLEWEARRRSETVSVT